jgi:protein O-GlcNAc transferase
MIHKPQQATPEIQPPRRIPVAQALRLAAQQVDAGRLQPAEAILRQILERQPGHADALHLLGVLAHKAGKTARAVDLIGKAIEIRPNVAQFHSNRGEMCRLLGRLDEAILHGEQAVNLDPVQSIALSNLGIAYFDKRNYGRAEACQTKALELAPAMIQALNNLGCIRAALKDGDGAIVCFRNVLEIAPNQSETLNNLGLTFMELGSHGEAKTSFRRALEIKPDFAEAHTNLLFALLHDSSSTDDEQATAIKSFEHYCGTPHRVSWRPHPNIRDPLRRLRIGFVSGDLRSHAVAHFIEPVWRELDRQKFAIFAYSTHPADDDYTRRLKSLTDEWVDAALLPDTSLAERIRTDGIDILVDLSGHTAHNRLQVFARKPAPIQATWIGYPGTTGLSAMDYRITDPYRMPRGMEKQFTEKVVRLPTCGTFENLTDAPPVNELPALTLGIVTFGSFQRPSKLGEATLALWCKVLNAVPNSRMLIGAIDDTSVQSKLTRYFAGQGIPLSRLEFHSKVSMYDYLMLHNKLDMLLDTYPYPGGTTTNHGLLMGIPVLTMTGRSVVSWQGAAVLMRLGMKDWVAHDEAAFVGIARLWSDNLPALATLRSGLRERFLTSQLNRPETVARGLENAFQAMWKRWCDGLPAESLQVDL